MSTTDAAPAPAHTGPAVDLTSQLLAEHVVTRAFASADDAGWWHVRRAIVDTVAVAVAGRSEPAVTKLLAVHGTPALTPWAVPTEANRPDDVARVNGTAGHALDFDDAAHDVNGHPSVVLVTAVLAMASDDDTLSAVTEAYAVGHEVWAMLAEALPGDEHYAKGWHATSSMGTVAAAAAVARLLGLDVERTRMALGTAASMSAGSRQAFGSMTKPFHAGMAAANGVLAARLGEAGFTSDDHQVEGPFGYLALLGADGVARQPVHPPTGPALLSRVGVNIKRYPCCYFAHRAIDAAVQLRDEGLDAADVADVEVVVQPEGLAALPHTRPSTGLQAKFSMQYCIAAGLTGGVPTLADFEDAATGRAELTDLLPRIRPREAATPPVGPAEYPGRFAVVRATTHDGEVREVRVDTAIGDARRPLSDEDLRVKAASCLRTGGVGEADVDVALEHLAALDPAMTVDDGLGPVFTASQG